MNHYFNPIGYIVLQFYSVINFKNSCIPVLVTVYAYIVKIYDEVNRKSANTQLVNIVWIYVIFVFTQLDLCGIK